MALQHEIEHIHHLTGCISKPTVDSSKEEGFSMFGFMEREYIGVEGDVAVLEMEDEE